MTPTLPTPSFSDVRRNLDPDCSYIVLECAAGPEAESRMREAFAALPVQPGDVAETQLCRDDACRRLFLVVRLVRERAPIDRERILSAPLATDVTLLFYRRSTDGGEHGVERR